MELTVLHSGATARVTVMPISQPRIVLKYDPFDNQVNAFADGEALHMTHGLVRSFSSDDALSMVLAHEMAHNCQRHIEAQKSNQMLGALVDVLAAAGGSDTNGAFSKIGATAYSQDFEREADYVGLYYLARAGQSLTKARDAFRTLTVETGGGLTAAYGASHPSNPERFIRLQSTEAEINDKIARGAPLMPDKKRN